ncbi:MAG: SusE domain-containing protein [Bacteroidales bacterium]|nr:SusE domain-containing protein [Bacteroidales bacterium]
MKKVIIAVAAALVAFGACTSCIKHNIDNSYSKSNSIMEIKASATSVVLDETKPDDVVLTISWNPAYDYGDDYVMTYEYSVEVPTSKASALTEYEDDGNFTRSYTNKQLQDMLTGHFAQETRKKGQLKFSISATYSGPRVVLPDMSSVTIDVKTWGPVKFAADKVFIGGSAIASQQELSLSGTVYTWQGSLSKGKINFPIEYEGESNTIIPASGADTAVSGEAQAATAVEGTSSFGWTIADADNYRVTLNFTAKTVTVIPTSQIFEVEKIFLAGSAAPGEDIEVAPTLENPAVYAYHGELKAGNLYLPVLFDEATTLSIVPAGDSHAIADGEAVSFGQALTASAPSTKYWTIDADGVYRIVIDTNAKTIAIYSPATDPKNKEVSYNNTVEGINPYTQEVTELWMWGGFNAAEKDADQAKAGFMKKYTLQQSAANPYVFVYFGEELPRKTGNYNSKNAETGATSGAGWLTFLVSNIENNVYAYGSTADAKRNDHTGTVEPALGESSTIVGGQSHNRYAYFVIPEGANYVEVDIDKMTVVFDKR